MPRRRAITRRHPFHVITSPADRQAMAGVTTAIAVAIPVIATIHVVTTAAALRGVATMAATEAMTDEVRAEATDAAMAVAVAEEMAEAGIADR